jgi:ubiquinone biosynthesis protein UbiJ
MASRKMTFTLPDGLANKFLQAVPGRERSRYVAEAIAARLREREDRLIRACEIANANADVSAIEREWDALPEKVAELWTDAPPR